MPEEFLSPKLTGDRFANHSVPLELLRDFSVLQEMLVEVAKWEFLQVNRDRERSPKNFTIDFDLRLEAIEEGSAILKIALFFGSLFPSSNLQYFQQAREDIVGSIAAVQTGERPTLPPKYLSYFDRFGRGLREGEAISFPYRDGRAELTLDVRNRLIQLAEVKEWSDEVSVRVRIPEADKARKSFEMEFADGTKLSAVLASPYREVVLGAFDKFETGSEEYVFFQGVVRKDREGHLKGIDSIEHITALDPLDIGARLDALAQLKEGWLDGDGVTYDRSNLEAVTKLFDKNYDSTLPLPYIYPVPTGELEAEWSIGSWSASLEINVSDLHAEFQALELKSGDCHEFTVSLAEAADWKKLNQALAALGESRAGEVA